MTRQGTTGGARGARRWKSGATKSIRVPEAIADRVLAYARELDQRYEPPVPMAAPPSQILPCDPPTPALAPPAWVRDAVFYQIFVDRFANGDPTTDPAGAVRWGSKPRNFNHFGGDLAGVRQKLPYLQELGVTALYFNPIFKAPSNHKYDASDYMAIDPGFGSNREFAALLEDCHARGLRVILDGVFNHTGDRHPFFRDAVRHGPASRYWSWYTFFGHPVVTRPRPNYEAWWGYAHLPKLRVANNPAVQEYIFQVTEHWTRLGIDGWRLDVPTEIASPTFWRAWRERVRRINPDAYLVGEIWDEGLEWVHGHPFDAVTNYRFREAALDFFAKGHIPVDALDARLSALRERLGAAGTEATFNLLSSHDVPRFVTEAGGNLDRVRDAVFFQLVSPGAPVIYYGEELGLTGGKDPDNRRCMPWSRVRGNALLAFYTRLLALRRAHPALRGGTARTVFRHNDYRLYAFVRERDGERLLVVMNCGDRPRGLHLTVPAGHPDGSSLVDLLTGRPYPVMAGRVTIDGLAPHTGLVLAPGRANG